MLPRAKEKRRDRERATPRGTEAVNLIAIKALKRRPTAGVRWPGCAAWDFQRLGCDRRGRAGFSVPGEMTDFDVMVVWGGVAGCATALGLLSVGLRVRLLYQPEHVPAIESISRLPLAL